MRAVKNGGRQRRVQIAGASFWVREMSNDDQPDEHWAEKQRRLRPEAKPLVILTVCPDRFAEGVLNSLRRYYNLYFWVICRAAQDNDDRVICNKELQMLRSVGKVVEEFKLKESPAHRARKFKAFVARYT